MVIWSVIFVYSSKYLCSNQGCIRDDRALADLHIDNLHFDFVSNTDFSVSLLFVFQVVDRYSFFLGFVAKYAIIVIVIVFTVVRAYRLFLFLRAGFIPSFLIENEPLRVDLIDDRRELALDRAHQGWLAVACRDSNRLDPAEDLRSDLWPGIQAGVPNGQVHVRARVHDSAPTSVQHLFLAFEGGQNPVLLRVPVANFTAKLPADVFFQVSQGAWMQ